MSTLLSSSLTPVPGLPDHLFRLNWASLSSGDKRDDSPDYTIFVGDLAADVTDYVLLETFKASYPSVKGAKVVIDRATGRTKGYGFVRFSDESEQIRAMSEMNGIPCSSRPMRIGPAASKKGVSGQRVCVKARESRGSLIRRSHCKRRGFHPDPLVSGRFLMM
ncbi:unnamed protein product [Brassica napus]|uniref:(rape) hypothetical protein n=1 Tax=Brassica napus TaxID=3708 RepID=A0A816PLM2_BRANA|nr:unnamed protein product [Brassica napus]